jgi:oxygen-independent coproporphyrinogen-3 oxidase
MGETIGTEALAALIGKYEGRAARYTSYPPIPYWHDVDAGQVAGWLAEPGSGPLSLYTHIPFCRSHCTYCGCFVIISPHRKPVDGYLEAVHREMALVRERLPGARPVRQYHLGGGTPTYISPEDMTALTERARALFPFEPDVEMSIEVDPRTVSPEDLAHLAKLGFNRLSLGVQDFDADVQEQVNRKQPAELVTRLVESGRRLGYLSINFDLIYGLPRQTRATFAHTMKQVLALAPDRVALYNFAHLPHLFPHQRKIVPEELPGAEEKLGIFLDAREQFLAAGYQSIGMDHFARQDDELTRSWQQGTLRRNFMGYTTQAGTDLLGFGISAISEFQGHYWQNEKKLNRYENILAEGNLPVVRGLELSADDRLRQSVITALFCRGRLDGAEIEREFGVDFRGTFTAALGALGPMAADGLVREDARGVEVTDTGRLFLRNIAQAFDGYAKPAAADPAGKPLFSRTV